MTQRSLLPLIFLIAVGVLVPSNALAHCDTLRGPVVTAARQALETGNVNLALAWVQPADEAQVRDAFAKASSERKASAQARESADLKFFETVVRVHRAGEGAAFEGIKPADSDLGPAIPAADKAIESGSVDGVSKLLDDTVHQGVQARLQGVLVKKHYDPNDLEAGRAYVRAYVEYTHYVEGLYQNAASASPHHEHGSSSAEHHQHGPGDKGHSSDHGGHTDHRGHLPWLLAGLLGLVVVGESSWLVLRRQRTAR